VERTGTENLKEPKLKKTDVRQKIGEKAKGNGREMTTSQIGRKTPKTKGNKGAKGNDNGEKNAKPP